MEKPVVIMKDWAVVGDDTGNPYRAPEYAPPHLHGRVFGHPRKADGSEVTTSRIVSVEGRRIETRHTVYWLEGPPEPTYVAWCNEHGIPPPTEAVPIRLVLAAAPTVLS
jgi:hypothetical protein